MAGGSTSTTYTAYGLGERLLGHLLSKRPDQATVGAGQRGHAGLIAQKTIYGLHGTGDGGLDGRGVKSRSVGVHTALRTSSGDLQLILHGWTLRLHAGAITLEGTFIARQALKGT